MMKGGKVRNYGDASQTNIHTTTQSSRCPNLGAKATLRRRKACISVGTVHYDVDMLPGLLLFSVHASRVSTVRQRRARLTETQ